MRLQKKDAWVGKTVKELCLPHGTIVAMVRRGREHIVPRGDVVLKDNDVVVLGAEALKDDKHIDLKELVLAKHPHTRFIIEPTTALCSFYAEAGGLMIGFEGGYNPANDPDKF